MLQVMQHAEYVYPKAIHSPITIQYHTYVHIDNIICPKKDLRYHRNGLPWTGYINVYIHLEI